jgi:hypothetical protein
MESKRGHELDSNAESFVTITCDMRIVHDSSSHVDPNCQSHVRRHRCLVVVVVGRFAQVRNEAARRSRRRVLGAPGDMIPGGRGSHGSARNPGEGGAVAVKLGVVYLGNVGGKVGWVVPRVLVSHLTHTLTPSLSSPLIPSQLSLFSPSREKLPSLFYIMF